MKVLLVGNSAADRQRSMLGFVGALRNGLEDRGVSVHVVAPQPRLAMSAGARRWSGTRKWLSYLDKYLLFPPVLRKELARFRPDVVHIGDQGNALYVPFVQGYPHVITCHDLIAVRSALGQIPENPVGNSGRMYQRLIFRGLSQAQHIACDSEATQRDAHNILPAAVAKRATRISPGLFAPCQAMPEKERRIVLERLGLDPARPFLLHVGGNQFYKNRPGVLRIYSSLQKHFQESGNLCSPDLVMVGEAFTPEMRRTVEADANLRGHVHERPEVGDDELRTLYSGAEALLFPSLYEGFGMPIIEAQACGCPVFVSGRAPMTEVGGAGAAYINPERPEEAAQSIARALADPGTCSRMIAAGYKNIRSRFTTEHMINAYIKLYEKAAATRVTACAVKERI